MSRMSSLARESALARTFMQSDTEMIIQRERKRSQRLQNPGKMHWKLATSLAIKSIRSKRHYQDNLSVPQVEHMSEVDCFDGEAIRRKWGASPAEDAEKEKDRGETNSHVGDDGDLLHIHPLLDGRFKDVGRA